MPYNALATGSSNDNWTLPPPPDKTFRCDEETALEIFAVYRQIMNDVSNSAETRMQAANALSYLRVEIYKEEPQ